MTADNRQARGGGRRRGGGAGGGGVTAGSQAVRLLIILPPPPPFSLLMTVAVRLLFSSAINEPLAFISRQSSALPVNPLTSRAHELLHPDPWTLTRPVSCHSSTSTSAHLLPSPSIQPSQIILAFNQQTSGRLLLFWEGGVSGNLKTRRISQSGPRK